MSSALPQSIPAPDELRTLRDTLDGVLDGSAPQPVSVLQGQVSAAMDALMMARPQPPDPDVDGTLAGERVAESASFGPPAGTRVSWDKGNGASGA